MAQVSTQELLERLERGEVRTGFHDCSLICSTNRAVVPEVLYKTQDRFDTVARGWLT